MSIHQGRLWWNFTDVSRKDAFWKIAGSLLTSGWCDGEVAQVVVSDPEYNLKTTTI